MNNFYISQPYEVGSKSAKSLAIVIPAPLRKQANITTSTILLLKIDEKTKQITLRNISNVVENYENIVIPAGKSFLGSDQQVSSESQ